MKVTVNLPQTAFFEKFFAMTGLIILFLAACSNKLNAPALAIHPMPKTEYIFHNIIVHDTVYAKKKLYSDDRIFQDRLERLMEKTSSDVYDLKNLNIEWQKTTLLLMDRTRGYRNANDSLYVVVQALDKKQDSAIRIANRYYKQFQEAQVAKDQNAALNKSINWQVYISFSIIVLFLIAIQITLNRIGRKQREKLNYL